MDKVIYEDDENMVCLREDVETIFNEVLNQMRNSGDYDKEDMVYYEEEARYIIEQAKKSDSLVVGYKDNPMSGFFTKMSDKKLIDFLKEREERENV